MPNTVHPQSKARVNGVTGEQTVKSSPAYLHRVVLSVPSGGGASTLTLRDGTGSGNDVFVMEVSPGDTVSAEFGVMFDTDLRVVPSSTGVDALIIYD